ncbi:hypothetical protein M9Y10_029100 [Tritrichomonas musculus]|uniref:Uncharacterized protein n=1 Tax=Tritrichomonas musculus TaxID=1915356 RepID=A0ABR2KL63_9EUKA
MDVYEQFVPPPPIDTIRDGLPNLRHGTVEMHPLEVHLKKLANEEVDTDFENTANLFGIGFAKELKQIRKIVDNTLLMYNGCDLGHELVTGEIDDIDFKDMFEPNQIRYDIKYDHSVELEKRVFGQPLRLDI